ncbi:hypothetical protein E3Q13_04237 [Wallemia mellicola]|nr:hypothetical protein E3Q13_04237 [Wallemia mellicola]
MTEKVENTKEVTSILEKCIEDLKKCNNVNLPSDKDQQDEESGLQFFVDICKGFGLLFLSVLVLYHVIFFLVVSFIALDLKRYVHFLSDIGRTLE